jgi:hypothetical protein
MALLSHPPAERDRTSTHEPRSRPWELELLISGAVTFALLQLPGRVDGVFRTLEPQVDGGAHMAAFMGYDGWSGSLWCGWHPATWRRT